MNINEEHQASHDWTIVTDLYGVTLVMQGDAKYTAFDKMSLRKQIFCKSVLGLTPLFNIRDKLYHKSRL